MAVITAQPKPEIISTFNHATIPVKIKKTIVQAELAQTTQERATGLMFRMTLGGKAGMLFVFPQPQKALFWMKNTYVPLDMIWLDENKKIVYIKENAQPLCEDPVGPETKAKYVLEVNAGLASKLKLKKGDAVFFPR